MTPSSFPSVGRFADTLFHLLAVPCALAQGFAGPLPPIGSTAIDPRAAVVSIVNYVLSFLALAAVVVIIVAGIRMIISQGEDEQKEKAKRTILYAVIGLLIVLFARVIVALVVGLAGETGAAGPAT